MQKVWKNLKVLFSLPKLGPQMHLCPNVSWSDGRLFKFFTYLRVNNRVLLQKFSCYSFRESIQILLVMICNTQYIHYITFLKCKISEFWNTPEPKGFRWGTVVLPYIFATWKGRKWSFLLLHHQTHSLFRNALALSSPAKYPTLSNYWWCKR